MQRIGTPMRRGVGKKLRIEDIASMFNTIRRRGKEERAKTRIQKKFEDNSLLFTGCSSAAGDDDYDDDDYDDEDNNELYAVHCCRC